MAVELTVVIPAFNEERRLPRTLERVLAYLEERRIAYEVLVVDDGSSDATASEAAAFADRGVSVVALPVNRGKGAAVRRGLAESTGERVLVTDADLSAPIAELEKLERRLGEAALILGSRAVAGADLGKRQPLFRETLGRAFNLYVRLLGVPFHDTQCGFKLLDGDAARDLAPRLTLDGFAYDVELVMLARRRGYRVDEVGVEWHDSSHSRVRPWRDGLKMGADVLRVRLRMLAGRS